MPEIYITRPYRKLMGNRLARIHNRQAAYSDYPYPIGSWKAGSYEANQSRHGSLSFLCVYKFEGYNPDNGYPTRATLEKIGLKKVADVMQNKGKLG
jgi:hypothetical protein